jgi:hypothetical protein
MGIADYSSTSRATLVFQELYKRSIPVMTSTPVSDGRIDAKGTFNIYDG